MQKDQNIDLSKHKSSSKLIVERALHRGWHVTAFETNRAILLIHIPDRDDPVKIFSASPPQMSFPSYKIAKDKFITNRLLEAAGLPVPKELLYQVEKPPTERELQELMHIAGNIVVKPLDAGHGKGITVNVNTMEKLAEAIQRAKKVSNSSYIILQQQIRGIDIRIVTMEYKYADSITRVPASVTGDGEHTIAELIKIANLSDERGENYKGKLNVIPEEVATTHLGTEKMNSVPGNDENISVVGISNIGVGGVRQNTKQQIPQFLKDMASKASRILELPVGGIDFIISRYPEPNMSLQDLKPYIIEANSCPGLVMYDDMRSIEQNELIDSYLDILKKY